MKKLTMVFGLLVALGSTGMASADGIYVNAGGPVAAGISAPGFRLVAGRPGVYCWYGGRYYSRFAWDRYYRIHRDRFAYYRNHRLDRDDRNHDRF